jgi:glutathione S-transferase
MLKVYGGPRTRADIVHWYLEELGLPYESVAVDLQGKAQRKPEYLAINPFGKIPSIVEGDFTLWESGAILLYLADKHGKLPRTAEDRAAITQWVIFTNATLVPVLFNEQQRAEAMPNLLQPISDLLTRQDFLVGSELSAADVALGTALFFLQFTVKLDFSPYPGVTAYVGRLSQRPAFQKAIGSGS